MPPLEGPGRPRRGQRALLGGQPRLARRRDHAVPLRALQRGLLQGAGAPQAARPGRRALPEDPHGGPQPQGCRLTAHLPSPDATGASGRERLFFPRQAITPASPPLRGKGERPACAPAAPPAARHLPKWGHAPKPPAGFRPRRPAVSSASRVSDILAPPAIVHDDKLIHDEETKPWPRPSTPPTT